MAGWYSFGSNNNDSKAWYDAIQPMDNQPSKFLVPTDWKSYHHGCPEIQSVFQIAAILGGEFLKIHFQMIFDDPFWWSDPFRILGWYLIFRSILMIFDAAAKLVVIME